MCYKKVLLRCKKVLTQELFDKALIGFWLLYLTDLIFFFQHYTCFCLGHCLSCLYFHFHMTYNLLAKKYVHVKSFTDPSLGRDVSRNQVLFLMPMVHIFKGCSCFQRLFEFCTYMFNSSRIYFDSKTFLKTTVLIKCHSNCCNLVSVLESVLLTSFSL